MKGDLVEAATWLAANLETLVIGSADSVLVAGPVAGAPTRQRVRVVLVPEDVRRRDWSVSGEGETILEATQRAVGALPPRG